MAGLEALLLSVVDAKTQEKLQGTKLIEEGAEGLAWAISQIEHPSW